MKLGYIKPIVLLFWVAFHTMKLSGQVFSMAKSEGGWVNDETLGIETDRNGNIYWFININGSVKIDNHFSNSNFVNIKIDNGGNYVWFREINSDNTFKCFQLDSTGNSLIVLKGNFPVEINSQTYRFGSDVSSVLILQDSTGAVKLCSGLPVWVNSAKFDPAGNILITGMIYHDARLGSYKLIRKAKDYNSNYDGFLAKMMPDGTIDWAFALGSSGDVIPNDLDMDRNGTVYVCGNLPGKTTVDFGDLHHQSEASGQNAFVAAFTSKGETKWVKTPKSGSEESTAYRIKVDISGRPVILGKFYGKFLLDTFSFTHYRYYFISKYDVTGEVLWARKITETAAPFELEPRRHDLDIDFKNNIFAGITYNESFDFDGIRFNGSHFSSAAILCLNDLGQGIWGKYISHPQINAYSTNNQINVINAQHHGKLLIGGDYTCTQTQLDQLTIYNNSGNLDPDAFMAEISYTPASNCQPPGLQLSTIALLCSPDSACLEITGSGSNRYTWYCNNILTAQKKSRIEPSLPGEYKVVANDYSVCTDTSNVIILEQHTRPSIVIQSDKGEILCPGETLSLVADTEPNTLNEWYLNDSSLNDNSTVLKVNRPGIYQLYSRNEYCDNKYNLTIVKRPFPEVNLGADSLYCYNQTIQLGVEPVEGISYFWYYNDYQDPFAITSWISTDKTGKYCIKAVNECGSGTDSIYLVSSLFKTSLENNILQLFPNPFNNQITITFVEPLKGKMHIQLYDLNGRLEYETIRQCENENQIDLYIDSLRKGLHNLRFFLNNQEYLTKIIKL